MYLLFQLPSRRSFGHDDLSAALHGERGSPWCIAAFLCRKTGTKVCGFDSGYGYGRFKDICHMFDVNCYWEHSEYLFFFFLLLNYNRLLNIKLIFYVLLFIQLNTTSNQFFQISYSHLNATNYFSTFITSYKFG